MRPPEADPDRLWREGYQLARDYYAAHGDLLVPGDCVWKGKRLGAWIGTQRTDYKTRANPFFTQKRIDALNAIGMVWDVEAHTWQTMYAALKAYAARHGTAQVPQDYRTPEGAALGLWLSRNRKQARAGKLPAARKAALEALGVVWEPKAAAWEEKYGRLRDYVAAHGACPQSEFVTPDGVRLGEWLHNQKAMHRRGTLLPARRKRLEELGVVWQVADHSWQAQYQRAQVYYRSHGHLCPFLEREGGEEKALAAWLTRQRRDHQKGKLSPERAAMLTEIGMRWDAREALWQASYEKAKAFYTRHGHLRVPKESGEEEVRKLGQWIGTQRREYKRGTNPFFTQERIDALNAIGMVWEAESDPAEVWEGWYQQAAAYAWTHGHLCPAEGPLRTWLLAQRGAQKGKRGALTQEQKARLEAIGMVWDPLGEQWQAMYQRAKAYHAHHRGLNIPSDFVTEDQASLGAWIARQRKCYKNHLTGKQGRGRGWISPERIRLLDQLDMIWDGAAVSGGTSFREKAILYYLQKVCREADKLEPWQGLGVQLDIYLPGCRTGIEYDGCWWHRNTAARDERKGALCREQGVRLLRMREPGLPPVSQCDGSIQLEDLSEAAFLRGIRQLFAWLDLPVPHLDLEGDRGAILETYRDLTARRWERVYQEVADYHRTQGDLAFPVGAVGSSGVYLTSWIYTQRKAYHSNNLTQEQIRKLEELGIRWSPFEDCWQETYRLARAYRDTYGNLDIPCGYETETGVRLGKWLAHQREQYRAGTLKASRKQQLEELGIRWVLRKGREKPGDSQ